ncbi:MAG: methylenetetrahydrofolate reductase [NAD(P)H] [Ignavibacteriales bacterium]|nr:methylenetetrahydrofolate reductase [NAD(P)H] [Ignavibacteriales bacterium]
MHISEILRTNRPSFSFEFFPPKNEAASAELFHSIQHLKELRPSYVSVTYGAGGSTRQLTQDLVVRLQKEAQLDIVSHLTCIGATRNEVKEILERYEHNGIQNIMALHGDPPKNAGVFSTVPNGFEHAADLVAFIRENFPRMGIGVAGFPEGHPATPNRLKEIDYLKAKVDAGADYICTQLFFDNRDFYDFRDRCVLAGITIPIIAGIMPITTRKGLSRMAELALGARFPARLLRALSRAEDDVYVQNVGVHWATEQVRDLIDHDVPGIHFYTLNKSKATIQIYQSLGVSNSDSLRGKPGTPFTT